ncbi:spore coat protein, partial [Segatella copri]
MKAMKPFYFVHPQYGKLRVVVIGGKIYYCLMDVKNIFKKSVQKLYETIADSEGELKNLNIMMMKDMKIKYNLFFENQEMGKEEAEAENVNADLNFCDEQLVKDLVDRRVAAEKIAA